MSCAILVENGSLITESVMHIRWDEWLLPSVHVLELWLMDILAPPYILHLLQCNVCVCLVLSKWNTCSTVKWHFHQSITGHIPVELPAAVFLSFLNKKSTYFFILFNKCSYHKLVLWHNKCRWQKCSICPQSKLMLLRMTEETH